MRRPSTVEFSGRYSCANNPSSYHSLASIINFDSPTLVRALGSLLIHLQTTAFRLEEGLTVTVNDLRPCHGSRSYLRLEDTTLRTLRIFATDFHPLQANNSVKGRSYSKSKEGFSIYTLLDRTKSKGGKERLRQWMKQPLRDMHKIRQRHVAMELFLHPASHDSASLLLDRLANVGNMDAILMRMQRCCAQPNDFLVLGRMLEAAYAIFAALGGDVRERAYQIDREKCNDMMQQYPSVAFVEELMGRCHADALRNLRERLASVIDEEVTAEVKDHVVIHYGFHEELDRAKETFETLDGESFALNIFT
jgi:DNA mismatch repair protein MSH5